ncbi:disulfide bond formation protein B [Poseidonocella sedimentorum]|uniref:Disulfide bond formation protein DsbB n=1 Tax=Poseidonocella sedimentorum TaxID=871652 RepID=A0A1I6DZH8_9RHOB|nr:disulfide bond formation protein B [Poseidonocella sedimentorum]SFR10934.1 Disulfide bond formation protein DsbB [Poseidonocella sedimentorum]
MTRTTSILLAAGGSAALLLGALAFQHLGGLAPCKLCLWQRWPHGAAILIAPLALLFGGRLLPLAGMAAALATAGIGLYHTGVERGWWEGPTTCTGASDVGALTPDELFDRITAAPIVRCDEVPWELFTLSMASWNMLASLAVAALWAYAATRRG